MYAKDYRHAAWAKLSGNWSTVVVAYLIYTALIGVLSSTGIGVFLFDGVFQVGMAIIMIQISRLGTSKIETLFDGFRRGIGNNIVAGLLVNLFTVLWTLLFIIPGIVKSYSYSMTYYILSDNPDMSPTDAINASRKMMNGNKWRLFCLDFSFIGWYLLSILTLGVLAFWISPYNMMARAEFYESIKPQPATDDAFVGGMANSDDTTQL